MDGASAGRVVWINGYRRSWTAGWRSWSSASAPSGRLPLGWTGSDPVLLGHLPRNNRALHLDHNQASTLPTDHLGPEADLGTLGSWKGQVCWQTPAVQASTELRSSWGVGKREDNNELLCQVYH